MKGIYNRIRDRVALSAERGQTLVEYALLVATISLAAVGVLAAMTNKIAFVFNTLGSSL